MNAIILSSLTDSARDFQRIVWPYASKLPLVAGGEIRSVEMNATKDFKEALDLIAGIDAWQIQYESGFIRGIASRVQWGTSYCSFSIRTRSIHGDDTEYQKRLCAIDNKACGHLFPHLTIQAFIDEKGGKLLSVAVIETENLIRAAKRLVTHKTTLKAERRGLYGFIVNEDGSEFVYMTWAYLRYKKILDAENIHICCIT